MVVTGARALRRFNRPGGCVSGNSIWTWVAAEGTVGESHPVAEEGIGEPVGGTPNLALYSARPRSSPAADLIIHQTGLDPTRPYEPQPSDRLRTV